MNEDFDMVGTSDSLQHNTKPSFHQSVSPFLSKLFDMVDDPTTDRYIRWSKSGKSFLVQNHHEFSKKVLPNYFKHNTFTSFVRQLNMYNFNKMPHIQNSKSIEDVWEFTSLFFQKNRRDLLNLSKRKKKKDPQNALKEVLKNQENLLHYLEQAHNHNQGILQELLNIRQEQQFILKKVSQLLCFYQQSKIISDIHLLEKDVESLATQLGIDPFNNMILNDLFQDPHII